MRSQVFVPAVSVAGLLVIGHCVTMLIQYPVDREWIALAILTLVTGALTIKIPGAAARLSVSETFIFAAVLLFGSCVGTITVSLEIMIAVAVLGRKQRLNPYKLIFNVSSAAVSLWLASNAFYLASGTLPLSTPGVDGVELPTLIIPLAVLSTTYFLLNSGLVAIALAIEKHERALAIWRSNFSSLGINYLAGASLAALFVSVTRTIDLIALSVIIPLLLISYLTFKTSLGRIEDATRHIDQMKRLYLSTVETLATAIDAKDQVTHGHIRRVQQFALALASEIGVKDYTQLQALEAAALLHDTGKLAIPEHILNKPGKLTPGEFDKMKTHAGVGADILSSIDFPFPVVPIVRHHHESWDGTGYPDGLKGTDIPIGARILAVVDCFDALTSERPYRGRMSTEEALQILFQRRGTMYDPLVVDTFAVCWPKLLALDVHAGEPETDRTAAAFEGRRALTTGESRATREVPDSIDRTLNTILEKTGADLAILFATDREHDSIFSTVVIRGREGRTNDSIKMPLGYGVSGWVAVNSSTVTNADAVLDLRQLASKYSLVRIICVPIRQKAETVGVLSLYSSDLRGFSDADRSYIEEAVAALDCDGGIGVFDALTRDVILPKLPPLPTIH